MYIVTINNTYQGLKFKFRNFDDAIGFAGMAIENGEYTNSNNETESVKATITFVEEVS